MDNFQSVREVMDRIAALGGEAVDYLEHIAEHRKESAPRDAMTLGALASERRRWLEALQGYLHNGPEELLQTYFQYTPEVSLDQDLLGRISGGDAEDIVGRFTEFDEALIGIYADLARRTEAPGVITLMESLRQQQLEQQRRSTALLQGARDV
ncbi:MAG: hypothetical protein KA712_14935 [Myxococcales bacterium]|nr:hypothetical protein [Myxococcales bacterium]